MMIAGTAQTGGKMKSKRYGVWAVVLLVVLLLVAFAAAGCGGSDEETASPAPTASAAASESEAAAMLPTLTSEPTFEPAGPSFDAASVMEGKSIFGIPGTGTDPFYVQMNKGMITAGEKVGYDFTVWNNQGQLTQYQQGFSQAITTGASLIDLLAGPDPNALKPQIEQAQEAGILVVSSHLSGIEQEVPYVDYNLPIDYKLAGELLAAWVVQHDPTAHVLVVVSDEIVSTASMREGISQEFDNYGPDVEYEFANVPIPEWGQKVKPTVQSAIVADPDLTYVIAIYDSMSQFITPAVDATDSADRVKIIGFNGTPFVLDLVREGKVEMDLGESLQWAGWAIADAEMRLIGDMGLVEDMNVPFRLWTQDNAAEAGVPADFGKGYGDFQSEYLKLWQVE
jgi:ribose transport system substrate-binding protein